MKIKKGDNVAVIAGKDKGKTGKVTRAIPREDKVVVDGINMRKVHRKSRQQGKTGEMRQYFIFLSTLQIICVTSLSMLTYQLCLLFSWEPGIHKRLGNGAMGILGEL